MKKISYILFIITVLICGNLFAQDDANWYQGKIISDIEFEGLKNVSKSELDGVVNQYIGKEFSDELFLELQTLMYELDYFEFIVPTPKPGDELKQTVILVFQVQESPTISKIVFEGNDSIWNTSLSGKILLKSKDIYSDYKVERAKDEIILEYNNKGYSNVSVEVEKNSDPENNSLLITFVIDEGEQTLIREINFIGNDSFASDSKLKGLIETKKKSLFKDGVYKEDIIQGDKLLIEGFYHDNGYIKAKVVDIKTTIEDDEKKPENKNMAVTFYIEEGEQYTYGSVEFSGNEKYTSSEFDSHITQKYGDIYNKSTFDKNFLSIQDLYYNTGYVHNSFQDQVEIDEENRIVSHKITIVERGVAYIGDISISGNSKTKDIVLLRNIQIKKGDVFSKKELVRSYSNLMHTRLFDVVNPQPKINENGEMDLHYEVEEAQTMNLMGGISVSGADFEPQLTFSLNNLNFMGMQRTLGAKIDLGFETQSFSIQFNEPRIFNSNFNGGGSLSFSHTKKDILQFGDYDPVAEKDYPDLDDVDSYQDYKDWLSDGNKIDEDEEDMHSYEISASVSGGHSWFKKFGIMRAYTGFKSGVESYFYDEDIVPYSDKYRYKEVGEWYYNDKWWAKFILDGRDKPVGTTEGYAFSQHLSIGGILPIETDSDHENSDENKSHFIKTITSGEYFLKLIDTPVTEEWDFVLTAKVRAAYTRILNKPGLSLIDDDKTAQIDGMFVGRGWSGEDDGIALLDLNFELLVPLVPNMVGASLFFDAANLWTEDEDTDSLRIDDFKFSFGASVGITNQVMPISFYIAKTFYTDDGDIVWSPEEKHQKTLWGNATWGISFNMNLLLQ